MGGLLLCFIPNPTLKNDGGVETALESVTGANLGDLYLRLVST